MPGFGFFWVKVCQSSLGKVKPAGFSLKQKRSIGSRQLNQGGQPVPAEEVTSSATLLPWDHPGIAFCDWK